MPAHTFGGLGRVYCFKRVVSARFYAGVVLQILLLHRQRIIVDVQPVYIAIELPSALQLTVLLAANARSLGE